MAETPVRLAEEKDMQIRGSQSQRCSCRAAMRTNASLPSANISEASLLTRVHMSRSSAKAKPIRPEATFIFTMLMNEPMATKAAIK